MPAVGYVYCTIFGLSKTNTSNPKRNEKAIKKISKLLHQKHSWCYSNVQSIVAPYNQQQFPRQVQLKCQKNKRVLLYKCQARFVM